jgi:hypothetical protein
MKASFFDSEPMVLSAGTRGVEIVCGRVRMRFGFFDALDAVRWTEQFGFLKWIVRLNDHGSRSWQLRVDVFAVAMVIRPKGGPRA